METHRGRSPLRGDSSRSPSPESFLRPRPSRSPSPLSDLETTPALDTTASDSDRAPKPVRRRLTHSQSVHWEPPKSQVTLEPALRYRRTPLWTLIAYATLLVVPWILTCILDERPLNASTYHDQRGRVSYNGYLGIWGILAAVNALRAISGVLTIPVTSTILGYAVITFAQRRHPGQKLSMSQLFALADHGWTDITVLWNSWAQGRSSKLLCYGTLITLIGAVQQPLQSALVSTTPMVAMSCADLPQDGCGANAYVMGYDADPWSLQLVNHRLVVEHVANSLVTISDVETQDYLWVEDPISAGDALDPDNLAKTPTLDPWPRGRTNDSSRLLQQTLYYYYPRDDLDAILGPTSRYFVTAFVNGTNTGVLREHALRLNSTVSCSLIDASDFPSPCPGTRPLSLSVRRDTFNVSICAPGQIGESPWSLTRDRQDINEELYMTFSIVDRLRPDKLGFQTVATTNNFTMRCGAGTTLGYFELPNYMNGGTHGDLLEEWPDDETIAKEFNDYHEDGTRLTKTDHPPDDDDSLFFAKPLSDIYGAGDYIPVPGPLMTAALALFGNGSFLNLVADDPTKMKPIQTLSTMCKYGDFPFSQLISVYSSSQLHPSACWQLGQKMDDEPDLVAHRINDAVAAFFSYFDNPPDAQFLLEMAVFLANEATLRKAVTGTGSMQARKIYFSPGTLFAKPSKSLATTIAISILIFLQLSGLAMLVWYTNRVPTWAASLDAVTVAQIGRAMKDGELPPIGPVQESDRERLCGVDALVGVAEHENERRFTSDFDGAGTSGTVGPATGVQLALGGQGLITRDLAPGRQEARWRRKATTEGGSVV